jgi:lambda repressor-like predicted transcriptional regulator
MNTDYRIKELCKERGIRMGELARRIGYSKQSTLNQLMDRGIPSNKLIDIANVLGVSVPELFTAHQHTITCPHCGKTITIKTED